MRDRAAVAAPLPRFLGSTSLIGPDCWCNAVSRCVRWIQQRCNAWHVCLTWVGYFHQDYKVRGNGDTALRRDLLVSTLAWHMSNTSPSTSRHTCVCAQIERDVPGGAHVVMEARLGSSESEEHHKALKMLKLSSLRQLQREVSGCCRMKHVRCHCHRFWPVLCDQCVRS